MRAVKHPYFLEQNNCNTATFPFAELGAQLNEQRLDIAPLDIGARGPREDQFKGALVSSLHPAMVPQSGTEKHASQPTPHSWLLPQMALRYANHWWVAYSS